MPLPFDPAQVQRISGRQRDLEILRCRHRHVRLHVQRRHAIEADHPARLRPDADLHVRRADPTPALATNYQGNWWTAGGAESGWGVYFTHQGDNVFASWFTYDSDGTPMWLSATASRVGNGVFSGTLVRTTGPAFNAAPFDSASVQRTPVGTLTLTFADGNNATFAYTVAFGNPQATVTQSKQLTRLVFRAPGTICQ